MKANQFSNHKVRDLAWIITSQSLMNLPISDDPKMSLPNWNQSMDIVTQNWLEGLDENSDLLEEALASDQEMLTGKIFESYLRFFFTFHPDYNLLASNIQLIEGNRTLGEIDLIVEDLISNKTLHLEAACKFYLSSTNQTNWDSWIGPNSSDSLDKKISKLQQQINNINLPPAQDFLRSKKIEIDQSLCLMKGYFFHHIHQVQEHKSPKHSSRHYCSGIWLYYSEISIFDRDETIWHLLAKDRWFAPIQTIEKGSSLNELQDEIELLLFKQKRPVLLARVSNNETEDIRMFVVEEKWPH